MITEAYPPAEPAAQPGPTRRLGRSKRYTASNLPARLRTWHAPRANRWEHLEVVSGVIDTQWLQAAAVHAQRLGAGDSRWVAPGQRWRITAMAEDAGFALEIHADATVPAAAPQPRRAALLDGLTRLQVTDPAELVHALQALAAGTPRLLELRSGQAHATLQAQIAGDPTLLWHPLAADRASCHAIIGRTAQPVGLTEYLGRDHAIIEAALAGALRGSPERRRWLHNVLARHLEIEEQVLFPAWLAAGGRRGWYEGLCNEHRRLREDLLALHDPAVRRRFLLLLDGHDEKEEQIVYPDIVRHLGTQAGPLARRIASHPLGNKPDNTELL